MTINAGGAITDSGASSCQQTSSWNGFNITLDFRATISAP